MKYDKIHPDFRLNGISFSKEDLKEVAYDFIKEGKEFEHDIGSFLADWVDNSSTIDVRTSGSTGDSKKITLEKQHMVNSALATAAFFNLKPKYTALHCLPAQYIAGKMMLVRAMVLGLHVNCVAPNTSPLSNSKKSYDFIAMVPLQLQGSLTEINRIGTLIVGGAPVSNKLKKALSKYSTKVYETYGMTETVTHVAVRQINGEESEKGSNSATTHFHTLPNVKLSNDLRDCLVINAPDIADRLIVTNDVVELISETEFKLLGRVDNIINSGGVKLNPERIEAKLDELIDQPFLIAGIPDPTLGSKVVLVLQNEPKKETVLEKVAALTTLEKYELPKQVFSLPIFVFTENQKINRDETIKLVKLN